MTIRWPMAVLPCQNISVDLAPRTLAGPSSISGKTQVVSSDAGIWKITLGNVIIRDRNAVLTHRAIAALLEGRLGTILIPLCRGYQPVPADSDGLYDTVPHSDDTPFSDGTEYLGQVIDVQVAADLPVRATSMTAMVNYAGDIQPGMHFSLSERLYRVRTFNADTGAMTFRPPLREAVSAGTQLNFDDPVVRVRAIDDQQLDLELQMRKYGTPSLQFIEDV